MSHNIYFARLTINHVDRVRLRENCDSALKLLFPYIIYFYLNVDTKLSEYRSLPNSIFGLIIY